MKISFSLLTVLLLASFISGCSTNPDVAGDRECRTQETIGSKMRQSVCHSKERWAAIDAGAAEREENTTARDEVFRTAMEQAVQNPGPAFDTP